eukprot:2723234-Amphidinium_carterae.1
MAETRFACSRRELQESFRVEQSRFVSLVQQDLERVQRQREQASKAQDEAFHKHSLEMHERLARAERENGVREQTFR